MASGGESEGSNESQSESYVFRGQEPYLLDLYGSARALKEGQWDIGKDARSYVDQYFPQAEEAITSFPGIDNYFQDLTGGDNLGMQTFEDLQQGGLNPYLEGMFNSGARQINNNLQRNILPSVNDTGQAANPYGGGGSRTGIAEGLALSDANQQMTDFAQNLYGQAYDADQNRRLSSAQNYITGGIQGAEGQVNLANATQQGIQGLINLGLSPYNAAWQPLLNAKQIVGDPVTLNTGSASGSNSAYNFSVL